MNITRFVAKISFDNLPSQQLFKKLGYIETSRNEIFKESSFDFAVLSTDVSLINELGIEEYKDVKNQSCN